MSAKGSPGRKAKDRRYQQRRRRELGETYEARMRELHGPDWKPTTCPYCADDRPLRRVVVAMPPLPGAGPQWVLRRVRIDVFAHPQGNVVRDPDRTFRLVADVSELPKGTLRYRVHGASACAGLDRAATG